MTKIGKILLAVAALVLVSSRGWTGEPSLELTVDRTAASPGEPIVAQVTVTGKASAPQPLLKNTEGFETRPMGSSSQIRIINGDYSSSKIFQFLLTPRDAGEFTIGPAEITVGGKTYQSGTVTLSIAKGAPSPASPQEAGDRAAFVTAEISNAHPYVNEPIVYTFRFYNRVPIRGTELKPPDFSDFRKEPLGDARHSQKVINGQTWEVNEVQWALFPLKSGKVEVGPANLVAGLVMPSQRDPFFDNDPFFSGVFQQAQRKQFSTEPMTIDVRPLPEQGKPTDFSGLVGTPRLSAQISARDVEVGDSLTLTLTVQGSGAIRDLPAPVLEGGSDFKIYDDQPNFKASTGKEGLEGTKVFKKAIVPLKAGEITLQPFRVSYFDPKTGQYQAVSTDPISLHIRPSSHPEANTLAVSKGPETQGNNPLPRITPPTLTPKARNLLIGAALAVLLMTVTVWLWKRHRDRIRSNPNLLRRKKAVSSALSAIRRLDQANDRDFPEKAASLLRNFLGDRTGIDGGSLTPADIHPRLEPLGASWETRETIRKFLNDCDAALYGGQTVTAEMRKQLTETLKTLIGAFS